MARRLRHLLSTCVAAGLALPSLAATEAAQPRFEPMVAADAPTVRHFTVDGLSVIFQPAPTPEQEQEQEQEEERPRPLRVYVAASAPGLAPIIIESMSYPAGNVPTYAIVRLHKDDPAPSLLVQTYSGGAHCCADYIALTPVGDALKAVSVGFFNGGPGDDIPIDRDGDGRVDIAVRDDRFLYAFAPYYASWAPPMYLNVVDGEVIDVSTRPAYRKELNDYAAQALKACGDTTEPHRNGACAVYVALKARMGQYAQSLKQVAPFINREERFFLPTGCAVDVGQAPCPEGQEVRYDRFEDALHAYLKQINYLAPRAE